MRVLLIDGYIDDPGSARFFEPLLAARVDVVRAPYVPLDRPLDEVDAVVVSGSRASANDDEPWVHRARDYLAAAVARDVPVLGVCFGHQLLAAAVGGTVRERATPEVGFFPVELGPDPLLGALGSCVVPFITHGDEVAPSAGIEVLGRSEACEVQAFRVPGRRAWGIQFHLEYDRAEQERILRLRSELHPELRLDPVRELARGRDTTSDGRRLMDRFLALARG